MGGIGAYGHHAALGILKICLFDRNLTIALTVIDLFFKSLISGYAGHGGYGLDGGLAYGGGLGHGGFY